MLLEDKARLQGAITEEQAVVDQQERQRQQAALMAELEGGGTAATAAAAASEEDALDAFMSGVETQMEKDKVGPVWAMVLATLACGVGGFSRFQPPLMLFWRYTRHPDSPSCAPRRQLGSLQRELAAVEQQLARTEKLLKIADPDGWYVPKKQGLGGAAPMLGVVTGARRRNARRRGVKRVECRQELARDRRCHRTGPERKSKRVEQPVP